MAETSSEAKFSMNWKMVDSQGLEVMLTMRTDSTDPEAIFGDIASRDSLVEQLVASGYKATAGFGSKNVPAAPADPNAPVCNCGIPRIKKTGRGKRGEWAGWFCANRKCDVLWIEN